MKRTPNNYSNRYHFDVVFFFGHVSGFDRFTTFNEANDTDETVNVEINPKKPKHKKNKHPKLNIEQQVSLKQCKQVK